MLTIFALPKPFKGHDGVIQTNAVQSWLKLDIPSEIILFGDEEGTAEFATEHGIRHVPDIVRNEYGTPLVDSLFATAQDLAGYELICYINSDIILTHDFVNAIKQAQKTSSLTIGRRWDLDIREVLDFSSPDWEKQLRRRISEEGTLHGISGIDYFLFPRGTYRDVPPFAIGRTTWDNWLIYRARSLKLPVVDATEAVTIVHQNHDFGHIKTIDSGEDAFKLRKGIEGEHNRALLGGKHNAYLMLDATHFLTANGLKSTAFRSTRHLYYRVLRLPEMHPGWIPLVQIVKVLRSIYYRAGA
jgi:hypothetical protein